MWPETATGISGGPTGRVVHAAGQVAIWTPLLKPAVRAADTVAKWTPHSTGTSGESQRPAAARSCLAPTWSGQPLKRPPRRGPSSPKRAARRRSCMSACCRPIAQGHPSRGLNRYAGSSRKRPRSAYRPGPSRRLRRFRQQNRGEAVSGQVNIRGDYRTRLVLLESGSTGPYRRTPRMVTAALFENAAGCWRHPSHEPTQPKSYHGHRPKG